MGPFLAISFGLTWGIALLLILLPQQVTAIFGEINYSNPLYVLAVYTPGFAGIILVLRYYGLRRLVSFLRRFALLRASFSWWMKIMTKKLIYFPPAQCNLHSGYALLPIALGRGM